MIDFSDIDEIRRTVEHCNRIEIHPRHPYVGDLVHTAFSGTHQDAIKKGFAEHRTRSAAEGRPESEIAWRVPYLPIDPADIGRSYDAVVRVNSQSGKGGIAYLLEAEYGIELPRRLQIDFARHVQQHTDETGSEVTAEKLWDIFHATYLAAPVEAPIELVGFDTTGENTTITLRAGGIEETTSHDGVGPVEALTAALVQRGFPVEILNLYQASTSAGSDSEAITLVEYRHGPRTAWVAGKDRSVLTASLTAIMNTTADKPGAIAR